MILWSGGILIAILSFLLGKFYHQSELILSEKRRVFEAALREVPVPNDLFIFSEEEVTERVSRHMGPILLYASIGVIKAFEEYLKEYGDLVTEKDNSDGISKSAFRTLTETHNKLIMEMRDDALGWSMFRHPGLYNQKIRQRFRLPKDNS